MTNTQSTTPATDDQLAALYLRDRDIECPSCDYNRRDGDSSTCPECGCAIALRHEDRDNPIDPQKVIRIGLLFLALYAAGYVIANTASLISILIDGRIPATLFHGIFFFGGHLFWLVALFWTVRLWSKSRKGRTMMPRHFARPAAAYVIITFIGVAWSLYGAVISLSSVL